MCPKDSFQLDSDSPPVGQWKSAFESRQKLPSDSQSILEELQSGQLSRRPFLQTLAFSLAAAGLSGCRQQSPEDIVPYERDQAGVIPGKPLTFASAVIRQGYAFPVLVKSLTGRPVKIEGNPLHPASLGATDIYTQAELLTLYDPDRSQSVLNQGRISTWQDFLGAFGPQLESLRARGGQGLALVCGNLTSPTALWQLQALSRAFPQARFCLHEPLGQESAQAGAALAFGKSYPLLLRLNRARVIVSLDSDFLLGRPDSVRLAMQLALQRKRAVDGEGPWPRLYVLEPCPSMTGAYADHRLAARVWEIELIARALAAALGISMPSGAPALSPEQAKWVAVMARELDQNRGAGALLIGESMPPWIHALGHLINDRLGNLGQGLVPLDWDADYARPNWISLATLTQELLSGQVKQVILLDTNPVYDAPVSLGFAQALSKASLTIHLGLYRDETGRACQWHLPLSHALESWGDARSWGGTVTLVQPLIAPLYQSRSMIEFFALLGGQTTASGQEIVRQGWQGASRAGQPFDAWWKKALQQGFIPESRAPGPEIAVAEAAVLSALSQAPMPQSPAQSDLEIIFRPDATVLDGRYANNAWLQELPKHLSRLVWDNAAYCGVKTAQNLGLRNEQVVELSYKGRRLKAPIWVLPGHAEGCITLSLGYGRQAAGRVGSGKGYNAYALRDAGALWVDRGLSLRPTADTYPLACTQEHQCMDGREVVQHLTLSQAQQKGVSKQTPLHLSLYKEPDRPGQQWGMSIDLNACIGCGACTIACQAENNIPVVGKDQVLRGREMHWIRVDRYYEGPKDRPHLMLHQPVPCMHCETAPCEVVCPVGATQHSVDGLNEMVYNRCVGTRYCSNNCPYKVRRFNYFQYSDRKTESFKLLRNPEVTVRGRGVMEKCTYCVQRIRAAQIEAHKENREIRDGEVVTACQQVCPTQAIIFGNLADSSSRVVQSKQKPHHYALLEELGTRPRTTYLAFIRNPNPDLEQSR